MHCLPEIRKKTGRRDKTGNQARLTHGNMNYSFRTVVAYCLPAVWVLLLLASGDSLSPWLRIGGATVGLLFVIKVSGWLLVRSRRGRFTLSPFETLLYWTIWPDVRPDRFADANAGSGDATPDARQFVVGYTVAAVGVAVLLASLLAPPIVGTSTSTWLTIAGLLGIFHLGVGRLLPFALRLAGKATPSLFTYPLTSRSVGEFWSERWNRPFVEMNRLFVTTPLTRRYGSGVAAAVAFLVSGLLHEMAISYAAGSGWGLPMTYFLIQGGAYTVEKTAPVDVEDYRFLGRTWTYAVVVLPLPLLFHEPFRMTFVAPLIEYGSSILLLYPVETYISAGLWIGAGAHLLVLVASSQVPKQLNWHTDLRSLEPLNRKLMWTYGGFIVLTIVSFGVLTAFFHGEFVAGNPVALGLSGFISVFWSARVLVDFFYFSHDDWPEGIEFVVGHALLTSLFLFLVAMYGGTVVYHLVL